MRVRRRSTTTTAASVLVTLAIPAALFADGPPAGNAQAPPAAAPTKAAVRPLRDAPKGEWKPVLLPPNDLTDPPQQYPRSPGGTCVGICVVTYTLWCCPRQEGLQSPEGCAVRMIHSLVPDDQGRFPNHPLPTHLRLGEDFVPLEDRRSVVRLAEIIQNALQPGGGLPKSRETIAQIEAGLNREPARIRTTAELERQIERSGGRLVVIVADVAPDHSRLSGHAVIVASEDGKLTVWDPNAKRGDDVEGSGKPAPLEIDAVEGTLRSLSYRATLPDGTSPMRRFGIALPVGAVVTPERLRTLPPLR